MKTKRNVTNLRNHRVPCARQAIRNFTQDLYEYDPEPFRLMGCGVRGVNPFMKKAAVGT